MSHQCGARRLPYRIELKEFEIFKSEAEYSDILDKIGKNILSFCELFQSCYEIDHNEQQPQYKLKNIDEIIPNYKENV